MPRLEAREPAAQEAPTAREKAPQAEEKAQPQLPPKRKPPVRLIAVLLVALSIGGFFGFRWLQYRRAFVSTDDALVQGNVVVVSTSVGGRVARLYVDEGAEVKAGQLLGNLDDSNFKGALAGAEAALLVARSRLAGAETDVSFQSQQTTSQVSHSQADIASANASLVSAQAALASARAQAARARADYARLNRLFHDQVISEQQLQAARATQAAEDAAVVAAQTGVTTARNNMRGAGANLASAEAGYAQVAIRKATVLTTQAQIKQAEAAVNQAKLDLAHTRVVAPVAGQIARRMVNIGELVQPGQAIFGLTEKGKLWVVAYVQETDIQRVHEGEPVDITIDAYPRHAFKGRVAQVMAATGSEFSLFPGNNASGNYIKVVQRIPVRINVDREGYELRPGMSAVVAIAAR